MARKFGLRELEDLGREVGGIDGQTVKITRVVAAVLKVPFTAQEEAEAEAHRRNAEVVDLGALAQKIEQAAAKRAAAMRAEAMSIEARAKVAADETLANAVASGKREAVVLNILGLLKGN